jgi:PAS domain S-box-containing protein
VQLKLRRAAEGEAPNHGVDGMKNGDNDIATLEMSWRDVLDAVPALIFTMASSGRITFVNQPFYRFTGLTDDTVPADSWARMVHPDDRSSVAASLARGLAGTVPFVLRQRIRSADGTYRLFEALTAPCFDDSQRIVQWMGVETDMSEEVRLVGQLEHVEGGLRTALDSVPQIVWTADRTGWIDWYNARWYSFTGQTVAEAAGWGWQAAHHPVDFPVVMEQWPKSIRTGEPFEMEFRLRRHDGIFRWMLTRVVPFKNAAGEIVRWYGSNTDIEDQKQAVQRSRRVATLLHEALLPDRLPAVDGLRIDALYQSAESDALVGGDWYDAVALGNGRVLLSCGDVTGHGLEAAAFASRLRQIIAFAGRENPDPASVLARINAVVFAEQSPLATAAVAVVDIPLSSISVALAGHPPPIVAVPGERSFVLEPDGLPLGVLPQLSVSTQEIRLERDAVFMLYTDGVTDFAGDLVAAERALENAASRLASDVTIDLPARFVKDAVLQSRDARDDIAILVVQLTAIGQTVPRRQPELTKAWRFHSSHALSAHNARREVATYLASFAREPDAVAQAELVIGELLANTVEHAPGLVEVSVAWSAAQPRLAVRDSGSGAPLPAPAMPDVLSEDGRGLFLVYALADDVRVHESPTVGTEISCTLRLERAES